MNIAGVGEVFNERLIDLNMKAVNKKEAIELLKEREV